MVKVCPTGPSIPKEKRKGTIGLEMERGQGPTCFPLGPGAPSKIDGKKKRGQLPQEDGSIPKNGVFRYARETGGAGPPEVFS